MRTAARLSVVTFWSIWSGFSPLLWEGVDPGPVECRHDVSTRGAEPDWPGTRAAPRKGPPEGGDELETANPSSSCDVRNDHSGAGSGVTRHLGGFELFEECESFFVGDSGIHSGFNTLPGQVDSEPDTVEPVATADEPAPETLGRPNRKGAR
jgi:hypothetical protein